LSLFLLFASVPARGAEVLCDPGSEDCYTPLLRLIQTETVAIDVAMLFMEDDALADAIIARHRAGVRVRLIVEPRRNPVTPKNAVILDRFRAAGIPMRNRISGGHLHWKFMIFDGQDTIQFSAANYSDFYFKPPTPYLDYTDEVIYFGDDPSLVNSFRRKFDDTWIDTVGFMNYANITTLARRYPLYAVDPTLNFVPAQDFGKRSVPLYDAETSRIDVVMYKITEATHADGLIRAAKRGVPVRLIVEGDRYRDRGNIWQAYHVDRLYAAGVAVRERAHAGFLHQKSTLLYGQALSIFGSSNWTTESNRSQYEHNYFTDKAWIFTWIRDNFERKWTNRTGNLETRAFTPLPPDPPVYTAGPAHGATGITTTSAVSIAWQPGLWAHRADIYFGTVSSPPLLAANVTVSPNTQRTFTLPALSPGTTYYWRVVSKTMASRTASGTTRSFTTAGGSEPPPPPPPPPPTGSDVVLYAAKATVVAGAWRAESDATAAGGRRIRHPDAGGAKVAAALASPANYIELTFPATAGIPYRLWIRGKADANSSANDSVYVQFDRSVTAQAAAIYRIGTTSATEYNLESCSACGVAAWGWQDNGFGTGVLGPLIYFAATGTQRIRLQTREDGLSIDQIVLSPSTFRDRSPGATKNDSVILPEAPAVSSPPPPGDSSEIVLYAADATAMAGTWRLQADTTAAGGGRLWQPNAGAAKVSGAAASPVHYVEFTFTAAAGRAYRLWMRGKAENNHYNNDSVFVQFSDSVNASGAAVARIGTTGAMEYNLESCSGCGLSGWGWEDNGWGTGVLGPLIYFATSGTHRIRLQMREDGLSIDQIILSPSRFLTTPPGAAKNDTVIVPKG
jgi:phosphatidylserine/phosphatidylglycerophosphate/cardiolipin synthase-like enzyme